MEVTKGVDMVKASFNPANFIVSIAVGWFVMSFLQSAVIALFSGGWDGLVPRFRSIAFFHDGRAVLINLAVIIAIGIVTTGLWSRFHRG
jgi:hypothetical protein